MIKLALRSFLKTPFLTTVAVISLALGMGANSAMFSLFHQVLLRNLPVPEPERLVNLSWPGPRNGYINCGFAGECDSVFSYPMFRDLERQQSMFAGIAAHVRFNANLTYDRQAMSGRGEFVSGSYFPTLGLTPPLAVSWDRAMMRPSASPALSY
jgi:hypothetical protein